MSLSIKPVGKKFGGHQRGVPQLDLLNLISYYLIKTLTKGK